MLLLLLAIVVAIEASTHTVNGAFGPIQVLTSKLGAPSVSGSYVAGMLA